VKYCYDSRVAVRERAAHLLKAADRIIHTPATGDRKAVRHPAGYFGECRGGGRNRRGWRPRGDAPCDWTIGSSRGWTRTLCESTCEGSGDDRARSQRRHTTDGRRTSHDLGASRLRIGQVDLLPMSVLNACDRVKVRAAHSAYVARVATTLNGHRVVSVSEKTSSRLKDAVQVA
jgi:hypothetical protein